MGALVGMRRIYAGADQCDGQIRAGAPRRLTIGAVVGVDIRTIGNLVVLGQLLQPPPQPQVVRAAGVFGADAYSELV